MTLTGGAQSIVLPYEVNGDTLTLTISGQAVALTREREHAPDVSAVRREMVGKWCWSETTLPASSR